MPRRSFNLKDRTSSRIEMTGVARRAMIQREVQTTVTLGGYTRYSSRCRTRAVWSRRTHESMVREPHS